MYKRADVREVTVACYEILSQHLLLVTKNDYERHHLSYPGQRGAGIAQSVKRLATGWTVRGSSPGGCKIFCSRPDQPWSPHSLLYNKYRVFLGGKAAGAWC